QPESSSSTESAAIMSCGCGGVSDATRPETPTRQATANQTSIDTRNGTLLSLRLAMTGLSGIADKDFMTFTDGERGAGRDRIPRTSCTRIAHAPPVTGHGSGAAPVSIAWRGPASAKAHGEAAVGPRNRGGSSSCREPGPSEANRSPRLDDDVHRRAANGARMTTSGTPRTPLMYD